MSVGTYKPYPEYKDSGVEWIGAIPECWSAVPVKRICNIYNGATPKSAMSNLWDGDVSWVTPADLGKQNTPYISTGSRSITKLGYESCGATLVPKNSIIISSRAPIGTLGIAGATLCTNQGCKSLVTTENYSFKLLYYFLSDSGDKLNVLGRGSTFLEISGEELGNYMLCAPPLPEQIKIAKFLDHETAKIDRLIEKQQVLIALLKEKRQAVISHAVTKGLNPAAPLKDSGIEWLGQVPAHWEAGKTKYFAQLKTGHTPSRSNLEYWEDCYIPWISLADVWQIRDLRNIYITETSEKISDLGLANSAAELLPKGTVIVSRTASVGFAGIMAVPMATTQDFVNWIPGPAITSEYLLYVFRAMEQVFDSLKVGSTHKTIYMPDVLGFTTPVPPLHEQDEIVGFIKQTTEAFDHAANAATEAVALLQERRTALISAAVTGKIDVRDWQPGVAPETEMAAAEIA